MEATPVLQPNWLISHSSCDAIQRSQASRKVTSQREIRDTLLQTLTQLLFFVRFHTSLFQ
jgi:hypothetical protein